MAEKIKQVSVVLESGTILTFYGRGEMLLAHTQTKQDGVPPAFWPYTNYVSAHLQIEPVKVEEKEKEKPVDVIRDPVPRTTPEPTGPSTTS